MTKLRLISINEHLSPDQIRKLRNRAWTELENENSVGAETRQLLTLEGVDVDEMEDAYRDHFNFVEDE